MNACRRLRPPHSISIVIPAIGYFAISAIIIIIPAIIIVIPAKAGIHPRPTVIRLSSDRTPPLPPTHHHKAIG